MKERTTEFLQEIVVFARNKNNFVIECIALVYSSVQYYSSTMSVSSVQLRSVLCLCLLHSSDQYYACVSSVQLRSLLTNVSSVTLRSVLCFLCTTRFSTIPVSPLYNSDQYCVTSVQLQGFEKHVKQEHNQWAYLFFFIHLDETRINDYSALELHVHRLVSSSWAIEFICVSVHEMNGLIIEQ